MSRQRALGTKRENDAVSVFSRLFPYCERRALRGKNDAGDLAGLPIPVECKANVADIAAAIKEAKEAAGRLGVRGYAAYVHARGKPAREAYGVVHAWFLAELLRVWDDAGRPEWEQPE